MNLKYHILWIENEKDWVESVEDQIQDYLEDLGFLYEKMLVAKEEKNINYSDFDLILMDLNLADQPNGAELISKIRDLGVYTDVVFYSASGIEELRAKGRDKELEGVFYSGRTPETAFVNRVKAVIYATLKKVQDLNNLRGLVMAEVSELDAMMDGIILSHFNTVEMMELFHKHVTSNREKSLRKSLSCSNNCKLSWRCDCIQEIVPQLDSSQKARALKIILEQTTPELYKEKNFYEEYVEAIINPRNELAHCKSKIHNGVEVLVTKNGDKYFDDIFFKDIRKNILKYSSLFIDLME
ncbi:MAG: response regulator [Bacteroidales bacterium]|nr:response regulator [Bacteroidales bacterium]